MLGWSGTHVQGLPCCCASSRRVQQLQAVLVGNVDAWLGKRASEIIGLKLTAGSYWLSHAMQDKSCPAACTALTLAPTTPCPFYIHSCQSGPLQLHSLAPCACNRSISPFAVSLCTVPLHLDVSKAFCTCLERHLVVQDPSLLNTFRQTNVPESPDHHASSPLVAYCNATATNVTQGTQQFAARAPPR